MAEISPSPNTLYTIDGNAGWTHVWLRTPTGQEIAHFFNREDAAYAANCINQANANVAALAQVSKILQDAIADGQCTEDRLQAALDLINSVRSANQPVSSTRSLN